MKRMMMLPVLLVLCGGALAGDDTPEAREAAAECFMRVSNMEKSYESAMKELTQQMPARERQKFKNMMDNLVPPAMLKRLYLESATRTFTAQELNAMCDFYSTELGASVMSKMDTYVANTMSIMQQEIAARMETMMRQDAKGTRAR
ncbi:MAG: hypothetical protein RIR70_161 [Pseudomonadota bacterium]